MKNKDLVFFAVSALALGLFMLMPLAGDISFSESIPGFAFCQEWFSAGEQYVLHRN